ncbi:hypothetical protein [Gloeobacter morelensis]|uniref:Extradiol ring-cleavage dioxygenase LigAB LigA subunit domain-containing protein n=1 Tax=Gloeobacter morelensis MG652769 TaxID=2781736 RepID=A0ABY3PSU2_9CYAN|nr:hypothetical protein [Gloeobacter morelensis]UFP96812.1 hypothetical protein ISF26_11630 [Gloeobacter morelensis MG652769]
MNDKARSFLIRLTQDPFLAQRFRQDPEQRRAMLEAADFDASTREALESRDEHRIAQILGISSLPAFMIVAIIVPNGPF